MMELMDLMGRDITETGPSLTTYCKGNSCTLKDSMTRNYIPTVDEEYKFTRPEFAMFLGISTNALRMRMRRGGFGDMYVIKNGKYLFKRPGPLQDKRPLVDHVAAPAGTTKRIRNRGAHKNGTAKYTSEAFRRHNEMKILNSINGKFKSDEHRRRFEELNDAALKKIDEDIKAEKLTQSRSMEHEAGTKNSHFRTTTAIFHVGSNRGYGSPGYFGNTFRDNRSYEATNRGRKINKKGPYEI